ncbi:hypothetical protein LXL04_007672 [Taraxacum kok-saghyz]
MGLMQHFRSSTCKKSCLGWSCQLLKNPSSLQASTQLLLPSPLEFPASTRHIPIVLRPTGPPETLSQSTIPLGGLCCRFCLKQPLPEEVAVPSFSSPSPHTTQSTDDHLPCFLLRPRRRSTAGDIPRLSGFLVTAVTDRLRDYRFKYLSDKPAKEDDSNGDENEVDIMRSLDSRQSTGLFGTRFPTLKPLNRRQTLYSQKVQGLK